MVRGSFALVMIMALLAIVASEQAPKAPGELNIPSTLDFGDVDAYLKNDRLRDETYHCALGDGPCKTKLALADAKYGPEIIKTKCAKCSPSLKEFFVKARKWYLENRPEEYYAYLTKIYGVDARNPTLKTAKNTCTLERRV